MYCDNGLILNISRDIHQTQCYMNLGTIYFDKSHKKFMRS